MISTQVDKNYYVGNDSTATFDYTFKVFSQNDLLVIVYQGTTENSLVLNTDYTIDAESIGEDAGGTISLTSEGQDWIDEDGFLATGYSLEILRNAPYTQPTDVRNQGDFFPDTIEDAYDYLCMQVQQLREMLSRAMKFQITTSLSEAQLTLLTPPAGGQLIHWNDANDGFEFISDSGITGPTGPAGTPGANFFTGVGTPSNTLGNNGDSYMDVNLFNVWQKSSGTWSISYSGWTKYSLTAGAGATSLTNQTFNPATYSSVEYKYEVICGTTVFDNGSFFLQYKNSTWQVVPGEDSGDLSNVTFTVTTAAVTGVAQLFAALGGSTNGTVKVSRVCVPT